MLVLWVIYVWSKFLNACASIVTRNSLLLDNQRSFELKLP